MVVLVTVGWTVAVLSGGIPRGWPGVHAWRDHPVLQERPGNVASCLGRGRESVLSDVAVLRLTQDRHA